MLTHVRHKFHSARNAAVRTTTEIAIGNDLIIDSLFNTATINSAIQCHNRAPLRCDISFFSLFFFVASGSIERNLFLCRLMSFSLIDWQLNRAYDTIEIIIQLRLRRGASMSWGDLFSDMSGKAGFTRDHKVS